MELSAVFKRASAYVALVKVRKVKKLFEKHERLILPCMVAPWYEFFGGLEDSP
jgi:hypothetical protein